MGEENQQFYGVWKSYKSENFAAIMEKMGAPWIARKMAANANPTVTIVREGDNRIRFSSKSAMWTVDNLYEIGKTVEMDMPQQGGKQSVYAEWQDGKLVFYSAPLGTDPKQGSKQERVIEPNGEMKLTMTHGDVVAYRWFRRES